MWSVPWAKIGFDNCWLIKNKLLMRHNLVTVKQYLSFVSLLSTCLPGRTSIEWLTTVPVSVHRYSSIHAFRNYKNEFIVDTMNCHDHLLCMIYETCIKSSFLMSSLTSVFWFHYTFITNRNPALTRVNGYW